MQVPWTGQRGRSTLFEECAWDFNLPACAFIWQLLLTPDEREASRGLTSRALGSCTTRPQGLLAFWVPLSSQRR